MDRRTFLLSSAALAVAVGCKSKAQKQAEAAVPDLARLEKLVAERHVQSLARALPIAAATLAAKVDKLGVEEAKLVGAAFDELRNKSDDLRSAKRSYYALVDATGNVVWVDDPAWTVVGRKFGVAFPDAQALLAGGLKFAAGAGRFGGAGPEAMTWFQAAPIVKAGAPAGLLVSAWEVHEIAEDLQRQLQTDLAMKTVKPKARAKPKDKYQLALDTPDLWVAVFGREQVWLQEGAPQPLEDAAKALSLFDKTAGGVWTGTFDVLNRGWGAAAQRIPTLGPELGLAVLRNDP